MANFSKILQACNVFYNLAVFAKQKPFYMYHGTSSNNLPSILSQGLISNPDKKVWETDEYSSFDIPSRASVGGIYFTKNLRIAIYSANNATKDRSKESRIIIIAEIKPGSLLADEDIISSLAAGVRMPNASPSSMISCHLWSYLHVDPTNSDLISAQNHYIDNSVNVIKEKLEYEGKKLNSNLENRLKNIFEQGFKVALKRQVSHVDKHWYRDSVNTILHDNKVPFEEKIIQPDKGESEKEYNEYLDKITRVLRPLAISEIERSSGLRSGRVSQNVGYSGGNKIIGILKLPPLLSKDNNIEVIYETPGGIPEEVMNELIEQYSQSGYTFEIKRP